jgi:rubrerythrin
LVRVGSRRDRHVGRSRRIVHNATPDERRLEQDIHRQIGMEQEAADDYIATKKLAKRVKRKDVVKALDHIAPDELEHKRMLVKLE